MALSDRKIKLGQCVGTIIFCLVAIATVLIPFSLVKGEDGKFVFAMSYLPIISKTPQAGQIIDIQKNYSSVIINLLPISSLPTADLINKFIDYLFTYNIYFFYGILAANIVISIILLIFRFQFLRFGYKIISIIAGFLMIIVNLSFLCSVAGILYEIISSGNFELEVILDVLKTSGIVYFFALTIFSLLLIKRQFVWFKRREW